MKLCNNCKYLGKQRKAHLYICTNPKIGHYMVPFPHKKTRKACNLYISKQSLYLDFGQIKGMRFIEDYRGKFQGSDIWVIGADLNLDCYPDDFFDDKVSITINYACIGFPNSTYFSGDHVAISRIKDRWPHFLKKWIVAISGRRSQFGFWGLDVIYMKTLAKSIYAHTEADFEKMAGRAFGDGTYELVGGMGSVDYAIQAAAVLGAKRIILVGCSMTTKKNQDHAQRRGMSKFYPNKPEGVSAALPSNLVARVRLSAARFAETFGRHGVEVVRHRFDEEEGRFVFEEIRSERENLWAPETMQALA